jgi:hypothetical protein
MRFWCGRVKSGNIYIAAVPSVEIEEPHCCVLSKECQILRVSNRGDESSDERQSELPASLQLQYTAYIMADLATTRTEPPLLLWFRMATSFSPALVVEAHASPQPGLILPSWGRSNLN